MARGGRMASLLQFCLPHFGVKSIWALLFLTLSIPLLVESRHCSRRPGQKYWDQCCEGRDDECTYPIADTVCYCDAFCNRTIHDCCPDFWEYCRGETRPPEYTTPRPIQVICQDNGDYYKYGTVLKRNCNTCTCVSDPMGSSKYGSWSCTNFACVLRPEHINTVNTQNYGWQSSNYTFLWGLKLKDGKKYRLGTMEPGPSVARMTSLRVHVNEILPDFFDARSRWPGMIHPVQDQGNCGASWAFSTTGVASDRLTIHSHGGINDMLSPQQLLSCNSKNQFGCEGGHLDRAWWYMRKTGVVEENCYPYSSGQSKIKGNCMVRRSAMHTRNIRCPGNGRMTKSVYASTPPYRIAPSEREIMKEILDNGPVQATFEVKEDFYMYKDGVYRYTNLARNDPPEFRDTGYHSVKIIGWGLDLSKAGEPVKYWLCANSWGPEWGDDGYFKILRGTNECKIESFVVGVWGKVNGKQVLKNRRTKRRLRHLRHIRKRYRLLRHLI
ncbi:uncharacterized peptidase C1-like protein F26E4.3 [Lingula anatina]|uniref:Uncharacterized peptidase C1-like protein F26E4.3 n=1 Tax=Lingula anatina TaxID=7574 RepID=A0A1S3HWL2_LINAN|nr:uncharacterized peptidase C1-like protein F26E4.3 [Lingula anatina]XP_013389941.1 uncharacterized peptidase C1-like protein F26E4.3 [Lingula anatina]XP_013389942.1 uncharacterized peptidase C1-like protein F26E4.3 [Lingula anatina]XP_013389943.1 uncharacterized peptidase C1-like protein F26E4.3 [Lingula anatina]|eukprot:XP_013389940.1 uncharacterized peptidase C1-like protein F26E4.3 [Lingula anatina]